MLYNRPLYVAGTKKYTDLDFRFVVHPITKKLLTKTDVDSIKQSIKTLLFTQKGEKPFQPDFGSEVYNLLFEPMNRFLIEELNFEIRRVLRYEPRLSVLDVKIDFDSDRNAIGIEIVGIIANVEAPVTINILMHRVR